MDYTFLTCLTMNWINCIISITDAQMYLRLTFNFINIYLELVEQLQCCVNAVLTASLYMFSVIDKPKSSDQASLMKSVDTYIYKVCYILFNLSKFFQLYLLHVVFKINAVS